MTPEEIRENRFRTFDKLDALCVDKKNVESLLRKEREASEREMADAEIRHKAELESRDRAIADRDKTIADKDSEIAALKKYLAEVEPTMKTCSRQSLASQDDKSLS